MVVFEGKMLLGSIQAFNTPPYDYGAFCTWSKAPGSTEMVGMGFPTPDSGGTHATLLQSI
jgi:hypothetical protein